MKKPKTVKPFFFKDKSHQKIVNLMNQQYPINLSKNEDLVNRVHARCQFATKSEVASVVKGAFESMRDLLILGNILNFHGLFFDTKFHFYFIGTGHKYTALKVKISTPPKLREFPDEQA